MRFHLPDNRLGALENGIMNNRVKFRFLPCPICGTQSDTKVLPETVLVRYPLFCAKCRQETLVDVVKIKMVLSDGEESVTDRKS